MKSARGSLITMSNSYGGFIEESDNPILEAPPFHFGTKNSSHVTSGRSALACIVKSLGARVLYVPSFLCLDAIQLLKGVEIKPYELGSSLYFGFIDQLIDLELKEGEFVLLVDFFGLETSSIKKLIFHFGTKAIVDYSHNLYEPFYRDLPNAFASWRKWYGVTDGAVVNISFSLYRSNIEMPDIKVLISDDLGNKDYAGYLHNETLLTNILDWNCERTHLLPSKKSLWALFDIDHNQCMTRRMNNVQQYYQTLNCVNNWFVEGSVPLLYYPLNLGRDVSRIRQELINQKIFIPTLWTKTVGRLTENEQTLRDHVLHLPCDFRLLPSDIEFISQSVLSLI